MFDGQMELGLGNARGCKSASRRQRHISRAQWWFERMRQVVDRAIDWQPAPPPRPEQIWFPNTHQQAAVEPTTHSDERQICE